VNSVHIVHKYITEHPAPVKGLIIDVISYPDRLAIRLYRDNFNLIADTKQQNVVEWVERLLKDVNKDNPFSLTLEMEEKVPNEV
jgi:hypothetical protein